MLHDTLMLTSVLRQSRTFGLNEEQFYFNSFTSKFTVNYIFRSLQTNLSLNHTVLQKQRV